MRTRTAKETIRPPAETARPRHPEITAVLPGRSSPKAVIRSVTRALKGDGWYDAADEFRRAASGCESPDAVLRLARAWVNVG